MDGDAGADENMFRYEIKCSDNDMSKSEVICVIHFNLSFRCPMCCWHLPQLWLWPVSFQHLWTTNKWLGQDSSRKTGNSASCNSSKLFYFNINSWCAVVRVKWKLIAWKNSWRTGITKERFKMPMAPFRSQPSWKRQWSTTTCFSFVICLFSDILRSFV